MRAVADVVAAGAVVLDHAGPTPCVLLVHRPKYDDWSFPKGKLDLGEHVTAAAVREVEEETGVRIRLGVPLRSQRYTLHDGTERVKDVHYWVGHVVDGDASAYSPNREIDEVAWVPVEEAPKRLSYDYDRETLAEALDAGEAANPGCYPLVVLRHSRARLRRSWKGEDSRRPLTQAGLEQSEHLVPVLAAYGVRRVVSSSSERCRQTVAPYAEAAGLDVVLTDELSQEDASGPAVAAHVKRLLDAREPAVVCTHRPVLPLVFEALALDERKLDPGSMLVAHHRDARVLAVEQHGVSFR